MADEMRRFQKQLRDLLSSNVESLLAHVEDPKLLESSVTRLMGFMSAADVITEKMLEAEKNVLRCQQILETDSTNSRIKTQLREWERYRGQLFEHLQGLTVRLRNI